jgi:hypothetical protein
MTPRRRRASAGQLVALIVMLLLCIWMLYKLFIAVPPAPAPEVRVGFHSGTPTAEAVSLDQLRPSHHRRVFSINSFACASL